MTDMTGNAPQIRQFVRDLVPRSAAEGDEWLEAAADLRLLWREAQGACREAAAAAVDEGFTYEELGDTLGITKQTAWEFVKGRSKATSDSPDQGRLFT